MANLFNYHNFNRVVLATILTSFSISYTTPLPAQIFGININEAAMMVRLEKLVEKLVNSKDKSIDKMLGYIVDIKNEVETSANTTINIDKCMDLVATEIYKTGHKIPRKQLEAIKKKIKDRDKKTKKHLNYVGYTMNLDGYQFNQQDEEMFNKGHKHEKDDEDEKEVVLPALLVYGVTVTLCGVFLMVLPVPVCKDWGSRMVVAGVTACANSLCTQTDQNRDDDKNKK